MTTSRSSENGASAPENPIGAETAGARWLEEALRGAPHQLEGDVLAWIADLTAANIRNLKAANEQLRNEISQRERLERDNLRAERGLREERERFASAFNHAPIGMALIDMDGRWLQVNDALCRITGHTPEQLKATTLAEITHPEDLDLDVKSFAQLLAGEIASYQTEKRYRHAGGHDVWVQVTTSLVRDEDRSALHVVTQAQDISDRRELARRLEYLVDHDFLTGLLNRRHFEQELTKEVDRCARYCTPGAVLLIDLDNFKQINDSFGHRTGDDVLKGVAGILRQRLRQTDTIARVGGDEFAVLLTQTDADQVMVVAEEVVRAVGREVAVLGDQSIRLTASVGVAMFDGLTDVEVMACADLAMYEAKETGRDRFELYRQLPGTHGSISARHVEAERIRHALENDRLILFGQPILDLNSGQICQYELLLRLPNDERGEPLPPSAFLYRAERSGLIQAIDAWVVRRAIALIAEYARAGHRLVLNVNLSGKSIGDRRLATITEEALTEFKIDPSQLVIELTETAAISNIEEAKAFAGRLHARGCQFALDDFGAGFGSFYYLKNFPFDYLKIDGDCIRGLVTSPMNQLVISAIVSIARGMGKRTVAEFVTDEAVARLARELGVDLAQGYHIGVPRPLSEILPCCSGSLARH